MNIKGILLLYQFWAPFILSDILTCEPAEKNSLHAVTFRMSPKYEGYVAIRSKKELIGDCSPEKCITYNQTHYNITRTCKDKYTVIKIIILNASLEQILPDGLAWIGIKKSGGYYNYTCRFPLYEKVENFTCDYEYLNHGLFINCSARSFKQQTMCSFTFILKEDNKAVLANISKEEAMQKGHGNCTSIIPSENLKPGELKINVTMYPNVTGADSDNIFGSFLTKTIKLESPRVSISNCPQEVQENTQISCPCSEVEIHPIKMSIHWYDIKEQIQNENQSNILSLKADRRKREFYCQAKNDWNWSSEKLFYNLSVLFQGSVKTFTIDGKSKTSFIVEQTSSLCLFCETEGNPSPILKLLNGQKLLTETSNSSVTITYNMSCNSSSVFQCIAEQENQHSTKYISIFKECPTKLQAHHTYFINHENADCKKTVNISLQVYGFPKPIYYSIFRKDDLLVNFTNVCNGNTFEAGFTISYHDEAPPFRSVNLSFDVNYCNDPEDYLFIIDNGINPTLNYSFSIQRGNGVFDILPLKVGLSVGAIIFIVVIIAVVISYYCKKRDSGNQTDVDVISDSYEDIIYEDIELLSDFDLSILMRTDKESGLGGRIHCFEIDMSLFFSDKMENVKTHQYNILGEKIKLKKNVYNRLQELNKWDNKYVNVIGDFFMKDNECIGVRAEISLLENHFITVQEQIVANCYDYITVLSDPQLDTNEGNESEC